MTTRAKSRSILVGAAVLVAAAVAADARKPAPQPPANQNNQQQPAGPRPKVEVVFVLDTTGSMSGLIQGAKDKVWSIARHIVSGKPAPDVKIGLVAYRDIGDAYVTRKFALTGDLDQVFENLMSFRADGGGDTPEHVAKGLSDAVYAMDWSKDAMKMVFLVGDAPPHRDYGDGFDIDKIVKEATRREIRVHAVRAGNDGQTAVAWREIAKLGRGSYASIAQGGGVVAMATPMDDELAALGKKLGDTALVYGDDGTRRRVAGKAAAAAAAPAPAAADRAGYYAATGASLDEADVLDKAAGGVIAVEALKGELLPSEMRAMSAEEKKAYVGRKKTEREQIMKEMAEVSKKRDAYLREKSKAPARPAGVDGGFDDVVTRAISEQAKDYGVAY